MPSSYTSSARFTLQATGENNNTWGVILNTGVFQLVDDNINGRLGLTLSGTRVLTSALGAPDEARLAFLDVTGGTGGTITIPAVAKGYFVRNASAASAAISAGGTPYTFNTGDIGPVFTDGATVYGLQLSGKPIGQYIRDGVQSAIDYTNAAISAGNQLLPPAAGHVGQALMVRNVGAPPVATWAPSAIAVADVVGAVSAAVPNYWSALQSFGGAPGSLSARFSSVTEYTTVPSPSPISGLFNFDITAAAIVYVFWGVSGNLTVNFRGSPSASFASLIGSGEIVTLELIINQGATTFAPTAFQVDGVAVTPQWAGGAQPAALAGTHSFYSFVIRNNSGGVFAVWASMTRFGP